MPARRPGAALLCTWLLLAGLPAAATPYTWFGGDGSYANASAWSPTGVPGAGDRADILSGTVKVAEDHTLDELRLSARVGGHGLLTVGSLDFVAGGIDLEGGNRGITITGNATLNGGAVIGLQNNAELTVQGHGTWTAGNGGFDAIHGAHVIVASGATFDDAGALAGGAKGFGGDDSASLQNNGTYVRRGLGSTVIDRLYNTGVLRVDEGRLVTGRRSSNGGTIEVGDAVLAFQGYAGGLIDLGAGATLDLSRTGSGEPTTLAGRIVGEGLVTHAVGNVRQDAGGSLAAGTLRMSGSALFGNAGNVDVNLLELQGGTLAGTGHVTAQALRFTGGTLGATGANSDGTTTVADNAAFDGNGTLSVVSHRLEVQGAAAWSAGGGRLSLSNGAVLAIDAGARFVDEGTGVAGATRALGSTEGGAVSNAGEYVRTGLGFTAFGAFANNGTLHIENGTVVVERAFHNNGTVWVDDGAQLKELWAHNEFGGLLRGTGSFTNAASSPLELAGVLAPGSGAVSGGIDDFGRLSLVGDFALQPGSAVRLDVGSLAGYDVLGVSGELGLGGTLAVSLASHPELAVGDVFTLIEYTRLLDASAFDALEWHGPTRYHVAFETGEHALLMHVTGIDADVDAPPASMLSMLAALALLMSRGRCSRAARPRAS